MTEADTGRDLGNEMGRVRALVNDIVEESGEQLRRRRSPEQTRRLGERLLGAAMSILTLEDAGVSRKRQLEVLSEARFTKAEIQRALGVVCRYREERAADGLPEVSSETEVVAIPEAVPVEPMDAVVEELGEESGQDEALRDAEVIQAPVAEPEKKLATRADVLERAADAADLLEQILDNRVLHNEQAGQLLEALRKITFDLLTTPGLDPDEKMHGKDEPKYVKLLLGLRIMRPGSGPKVEYARPKTVQEIRANVARGHGDGKGAEQAIYGGLLKVLARLEQQTAAVSAA